MRPPVAVAALAGAALCLLSPGLASAGDDCPCRPADPSIVAPSLFGGRAAAPARDHGLALHRDPAVALRVPNPRLRAALALLLGTPARPAVARLLAADGAARIAFTPAVDPGALAELRGDRRLILIDARYRNEHPALLAPLLAHEALHLDARAAAGESTTLEEEAVAKVVEAYTLAELVAHQPGLVRPPTALSQALLGDVVGLVFNSRTPLRARAARLHPGSRDRARSHFATVARAYPELTRGAAPAGPLLVAIAGGLRGRPLPGAAFDRRTLTALAPGAIRTLTTFERTTIRARLGLVAAPSPPEP